MPQGPLFTLKQDAQGTSSKLGIANTKVQVKVGAGRVMVILPTDATATASVTVYDSATTAGAGTTNVMYAGVPVLGVPVVLDLPFTNGLVVVTGDAHTVAVSFN